MSLSYLQFIQRLYALPASQKAAESFLRLFFQEDQIGSDQWDMVAKDLSVADVTTTGIEVNSIAPQSVSIDALSVAGKRIINVNASGGNVVIGGFTGGITGQRITIVKTITTNTVTLEHNESSGDEKIQAPGATDFVITDYGGAELIFTGTVWAIIAI